MLLTSSQEDIVLIGHYGLKLIRYEKFKKPMLMAQGSVKMADCRPNSRPCGRPCNPPGPGGHR